MELIEIHPGLHILYYLILVMFAMLYTDVYYLATFIILLLVLFYFEKILSNIKNMLKLYIPLALLVMILNPSCNYNGETKIYLIGNFFITLEAVVFGIILAISLLLIIMILISFNEEISYQEMLYIISKKFPNTALVIIMSLRYIPLITNRLKEFIKINKLDEENKHDLSKFELFKSKIDHAGKSFGGVVAWSLEESMLTAKSMKARGYGIAKRTNYLSFNFNKVDYAFIIVILIAGGLCIYGLIMGVGRIDVYPHLNLGLDKAPNYLFYGAFLAMLLPKIILEIREKLYWVKL